MNDINYTIFHNLTILKSKIKQNKLAVTRAIQ